MMETLKKTLKAEWFLSQFMFKTDLLLGVIYWIIIGFQHFIPLVSVWLWKLILDEFANIYVNGYNGVKIWGYLGIYLFINVFSSLLKELGKIVSEQITRKATKKLDVQIMQKLSHVDTGFFDRPQNRDTLMAAQTSETYITGNMTWAIETVVRIISFIAGLIVFLSYDPILGLIYISTYIPGAILSYKQQVKVDQWSLDNIPENRKKDYYKSLLTGTDTAKDLRLYNLADYFKSKYNELWNRIRDEREKLFVKGGIESFCASLLTYIGIVIIMLLSVRTVLLGQMAIGTLVLYIGLAETSGENFKQIIQDLACQIEIDVPRVISYLDFLQYENEIKDNGIKQIPINPDIEFRNVYFKYPNNEEYTLKNLNLKIESGKKIALIGINGAGKSTLIKLLLRFYEPESGEILIGGKSIRCYPTKELNRLFGVCFQDVQSYALSVRENIAISDIDRRFDDDAVLRSAQASGADEIVNAALYGLESPMTRAFENDGVELSGGQWQKIALARAFFRNSQFVILDEPSSALDPEAEDYIFSSFKQLCKDKGGILITHRLSGIMMVDEIVLLDKGTIIESGTHTDLMNKNGSYAEMYRLQAKKYVGGVENEKN